MTTTTTSGAADLPEALRLADLFELESDPESLYRLAAAELRRLHALAAGQATAAQQGAAYAAPPEYGINTASHAHFRVLGFTANQMRAFADATCALRASHGQAPAQPDQPIVCSYGDNGYACCEGGPCQADVHNDKLVEQQAPATAQAEESVPAPVPPPECEPEAEKRAVAFGWFKALESERVKADSVQEDAAREAIEKVLALFPFNALIQKFSVNNGPCLTADNDDEFYSVKRVLAFLTEIKTTLDAARKQGASHDQ